MIRKIFIFLIYITLHYQVQSQTPIATTQDTLAIANHNQRKLVRDSNDNILVAYTDLENDKSVIRLVSYEYLSNSWELLDQIFYGNCPSLAIGPENNLHLVYQSNDSLSSILYTHKDSNGEWSSSVTLSNNLNKNILPVADVNSSFVTHIVWIENGTDMDVVKYANVQDNMVSEVQSLYEDSIITDVTVASDLLYHIDDVFVSYSVDQTGKIHFLYSKDNGENWKLFDHYSGSHPCVSVGFYPIPKIHKASYLQPKLFYLDSVNNAVLIQYCDTLTGQYEEVDSTGLLIVNGHVDELYIDDVIPEHGFGFLYSKEGQIYEAFTSARVYKDYHINAELPDKAFNASVAYKQFRPYKVDYVWMEDNGAGYDIFYRETQKFPDAIEPQNNSIREIMTAYPNPFSTSIAIYVDSKNTIRKPEVWVYSIKGQFMRKLEIRDQDYNIGFEYIWDGRDTHGNISPTGLYVIHAIGVEIDIYRTIIFNK